MATFDYNGEKIAVPEAVAPLFQPWQIGDYKLSHRLVYGPLTRCRSFGECPEHIGLRRESPAHQPMMVVCFFNHERRAPTWKTLL